MATTKPRITITVSEQQHELLQSLASIQKVSMSSIVVDLLDTTCPVLERLLGILKAAANAPKSVIEELRKSLEGAESNLLASQDQVMGSLAEFESVAAGEGVPRTPLGAGGASSPAKPAARKPRPPTSNRGVRILTDTLDNRPISPMKTSKKNRGVGK